MLWSQFFYEGKQILYSCWRPPDKEVSEVQMQIVRIFVLSKFLLFHLHCTKNDGQKTRIVLLFMHIEHT